jgi:AAA domain
VEGPSGIGKTTVLARVAGRTGDPVVAEAYATLGPPRSLRVDSRRSVLRLEGRLLEAEATRARRVARAAAGGPRVWLDTGFLGPITYADGLAGLRRGPDVRAALARRAVRLWGRGGPPLPELVVYLVAPAPTVRRRAAREPTGHPARAIGRHLAVARVERAFWSELASGLAPGRVAFVSARGSPGAVAHRLLERVRATRVPPVTPQERRAVLDAVVRRARAIVKKGGPSRRPSR